MNKNKELIDSCTIGDLEKVVELVEEGADFTKIGIVNSVSWLWGKYYE